MTGMIGLILWISELIFIFILPLRPVLHKAPRYNVLVTLYFLSWELCVRLSHPWFSVYIVNFSPFSLYFMRALRTFLTFQRRCGSASVSAYGIMLCRVGGHIYGI